jgi:hypothetical protein
MQHGQEFAMVEPYSAFALFLLEQGTKQPGCRCQASESVRLADTLRPKRPAALLPREKTVCFMYVCLHFGFYTKSRDSSVSRAR